jgi:MSHA biogenesis protein MshK
MSRLLAALLAFAACAAHGAPFADPTRPPPAFDAEANDAASLSGPRLESVLIAPDRRIAVISGEEVTLGSRFRGGEVVRITESEVRIRRSGGEESLKLFAGDVKRTARAAKGR